MTESDLAAVFEKFRRYAHLCTLSGWADGERWEICAYRGGVDTYSTPDLTVIRLSLAEALRVTMEHIDSDEWGLYDTDFEP